MKLEAQQLDEIESLLAHSMNGFHFLFDNETIARILQTPTEDTDFFEFENMTRVQELFARLVQHESLLEKREFLETLDSQSYEMLLRAYFHIVDNTLLSASSYQH